MAFAETANLAVKLTLGGNFTSQMSKARGSLRGFDKDASRAYKAGGQIGTGIKRSAAIAAAGVGVLVAQVGFGLDALIQLESATAQTNAVIKSTGGVAAQSADSVRKMAEQYESLNATIDDKVIQSGENLLLTFTNVRGKAFEPTLAAALDMNQALGGGPEGLQGVMMKVGKAMNSPAEGFTALKRSGVLFNAEQKKILKGSDNLDKKELKVYNALKKRNKAEAERYKAGVLRVKLEAAQALILKELGVEFGGSFAKAGDTTAGSVAKFGDAIEDLQKSLATALLPTVRNIADSLTELLADPSVIQGAKDLGKSIGEMFSKDNIKNGIGAIKSGMEAIRSIAGPVADVIRTAVGAFTSLPPDIQKLLVGGFAVNKLTGGLVTNAAGGLVEALGKAVLGGIKAPLVNVQGGVVNVGGGIPGGGGGAATALKGGELLASLGLTTATLLPLTVGLIAAAGLGVVLDNAITNAGGLPKAGKQLQDSGLTLGPNPVQKDPGGRGTAFLGGKGTSLTVVGSNPTINLQHGVNVPMAPNTGRHTGEKATGISSLISAAQIVVAPMSKSAAKAAASAALAAAAARSAASASMRKDAAPSVSTSVNVNVAVTAGGVKKVVTVHERYGPPAGSRTDNRFLGFERV